MAVIVDVGIRFSTPDSVSGDWLPVEKRERNLPHWFRAGATYFVTFRLADSVPAPVLRRWKQNQDEWILANPEPHSPQQLIEKDYLFSASREAYLNSGYGACLLRVKPFAECVVAAFDFFDGKRYLLGDFVIMPNHVHLLVTPFEPHELASILHSWKSFTAKELNRLRGTTGAVWQAESYDHIVRNEAQLEHFREYIAENPGKAGLRSGFFYRRQLK